MSSAGASRAAVRAGAPVARPHRTTAPLLSAIAGFVDTAGFLALFGVFTAHVTGNLVVAGATVARERTDNFAIRIAATPVFMIAVALAVVGVRRTRARMQSPLVPLLAIQSAVLIGFMILGATLERRFATDPWALFAAAATGVLAMGFQNGVARIVIGGSPTTIMTGNLTQFTIDLVDTVAPAGDDAQRRDARTRLAHTGRLLAGFVIGAAAGALLVHAIGFWCIAAPVLALWAIMIVEHRVGSRA